MRSWITCAAALLLFALAPQPAVADAPAKPNVVLVLIDDMGERDVGCYGSTFYETPAIDRLASQGMRFTQAYAACCVCSPTRAALLTGRSPARLHLTDWIAGHKRPNARLQVPNFHKQLPADELTLAEVLKANGYVTASVGKWHLGGPPSYPEKHGFDVNVAGTARGQPPSFFAPYKIDTLEEGPKGEYLTDRITTEAEKFIEANRDKPFFLYLPHFAVHTPIQAKADLTKKYQQKPATGEQRNAAYAAMVESTDESIGRLMKKLDELKLSEKTVFIFTSDNGGLSGVRRGDAPRTSGPTSNAPLRMGKGSPYEGGVRVPLIVRYPGVVKPGTTSDTPVISHDLFTTVVELTGAKLPEQKPTLDGVSLAPLLKQNGPLGRDALYWHYPHYHPGGATPNASIRQGDWKLIRFFEDGRLELYNLKDDPYEKTNVSKSQPDKAAELNEALSKYLKKTEAQMPTPNPEYDPNEK